MNPAAGEQATTIALQRLIISAALLVVAVGIGVLVSWDADMRVDPWWNAFVMQAGFLQPISLGLNFIGGGWFATFAVPLAAAALLLVIRRPWGALFALSAFAVSAAAVQVLKAIFGRARPEDILVASDYGSFPSGHTANAATIAAVAVVLFPRIWVALLAAAWTVTMALSRTVLHAHWLSDTVAGTLVGIGAALLVAAAFAVPLEREAAALG